MKYHSFYMRLLCLILIIGAVLGYNFMQKNDTQALQITELTDRVSALEEQQKEMLTALKMQQKHRKRPERQRTTLHRKQKQIMRRAAAMQQLPEKVYTRTEPTQVRHRDLVEQSRFRLHFPVMRSQIYR